MDPNAIKQEKCELNAEALEYLQQLKVEKENIDPSYAIACRLMNEEIDRVERGAKYTEVHNDKKVKLQEKVLIPVKEHPKFNFVGKLLGPQGNSLKRLQAETGCKMSILGKGSMRDKNKEDELRKGNDPKFQHLNYELHVLVEVFSTPIDAHARMSHALVELRKFLVPDYNDEIRQQQLQELMYINGDDGVAMPPPGPPGRGRGGGRGRGVPPPSRGRGGALLATPPVRGAPASRGMMPPRGNPRGAPSPRSRGAGRGLVRPPPPVAPPAYEEEYSYSTEYDDQYAYGETYEETYAAGSGDVYHEYGHGGSAREQVYDDGYGDGYGAEGWGNGVSSKPAPVGKMSSHHLRGAGRAHPYGGGHRGARY